MSSPHNEACGVDTHAHIFRRGLPLAPGRRHEPQYDAPLGQYLGLLDSHGIRYGVLTAPSFFGSDNSHLLEGLAQAKGRLHGTAIVDPSIGMSEMRDLDAAGIVGVRFNLYNRPESASIDFRSAAYRALFERCATLDWHVEVYAEGFKLAKWLPQILPTGVKVVVDHFGSPDPQLGVACPGFKQVLAGFASQRLWVKLSGPYRVGGAEPAKLYAASLLREGGPGRLVWGSDWPWTQHESGMSYEECLDNLKEWVPDEARRRFILATTPLALFRFSPA